jgi:phage gp36-like protein
MVYTFPYVGIEEVRQILVGRRDEDRNENANVLDDDQIEYAIISADAQIDGALRKRYQLPFNPVPRLVHVLARDIAAYNCTLIFNGQTPLESDHPMSLRYDRSRRILEDLRAGRTELDAVEVANVDGGLDSVFNDYKDPLFSTQHIFGDLYPEGTIPKDRTHF